MRVLRFFAVVASLVFLALPALAQGVTTLENFQGVPTASPGLPTGGLELVTLIVGLLLGVALTVLAKLAPLTKNTVDDRALDILKQAAPTIQKWLDPEDPSVPPSPSNPSGKA